VISTRKSQVISPRLSGTEMVEAIELINRINKLLSSHLTESQPRQPMRLGTASPDRLDAKWLKILDDSANSGVGTYACSSSSAHW